MLFRTTQEHEELRLKIRRFAEAEVKPIAFLLDQENEFPYEAVEKLAEMEMLGIPFPQTYGGAGLDHISYAIAVEELSRVDGGTGVILSAHTSLASWPIFTYGTEAQKEKYLKPLLKGEKLGAFAITEQNAGSDAGGTETTAVFDGENYILNGGKVFTTNADKAEIYVVFAVTTPGIGTKGISAFILEKGWSGFTYGEQYNKLGIRSSATAELVFNNVRVPKANLLGREGEGFRIAMATLDGGRIGIAAQAVGIAQGAYEAALEYAREREQFGKPIAFQQVISFKIADMATQIRAARMLVYSAAAMKDANMPYGTEAAMAKVFASETAMAVTNEALQIHGGNGFLKGMEVERMYRDAKITTIYEGTSEIQRMVIAANLIGKPPKEESLAYKKKRSGAITGERKKQVFSDGTAQAKVDALVESLEKDGFDFGVAIDINSPIIDAERVVSAGKGIGSRENMELIAALAAAAGAALGSSRPVAETLRYLPINRYVGMSGQKFRGNLYIAVGISGAGQHLKGIKEANTIVAINSDPKAPIFMNCDYGIVGDLFEIVPLLITAFGGTENKRLAPPMVRMKKRTPKKLPRVYKLHICSGCGYEYDKEIGDDEGGVRPGTLFDQIPDEWICPVCGETKDQFIEV